MKKEFWVNMVGTLILWPILTIIAFSGVIAGIILITIDAMFWPFWATFPIMFFSCIYMFISHKINFSKVIFSDDEIAIKYFKKIIKTIKWSEITNIEVGYSGKAAMFMVFVLNNDKISIVPTKKMYKTIIALCPYQRLIDQIESIPAFEWFRRKR